MKTITALALALLSASAAFAAAPVEIRSTEFAPALSPAAGLSAASVLPGAALTAPAAAFAAAPAFAPAPAPALAAPSIVPSALPALAPAAAPALSAAPAAAPSIHWKPAVPGESAANPAAPGAEEGKGPSASEQAGAAAASPAAAFDGSGAKPAALEPPVTVGEETPASADARLAALFDAAMPGSPAVAALSAHGGFANAVGQVVSQYTFVGEHLLESMRHDPMTFFHPQGRTMLRAVEDITKVVDSRAPAARAFQEALGREQAIAFFKTERAQARGRALLARMMGADERRHMPRNELGSGDYWDMAAGMNAGGFILRELEPGTRYSFFDYSPFVVSYLKTLASLSGSDAQVVEADLHGLKKPEKPLAVLRSKNAVAYVKGFEKKLATMTDWIAPGGRLILQNDPMPGQRDLILEKHGPLALRLLEEGWDFSFEFTSARGSEHALDTLIFTRPRVDGVHRSRNEARAMWERYRKAVEYANAREGY